MIWEALVKLALLGTDRGNLSPPVLEVLQQHGIDPQLPLDRFTLDGAALFNQLRKASVLGEVLEAALPVAPPENTKTCSPHSSRHLQLILSGNFEPALLEFISLLVINQQTLPPESLPSLFRESLQNQSLWRTLRPAIGARGEWLLQLNPSWHSLGLHPNPGNWETGVVAERLAILKSLRENTPEAAIPLLEKTWDSERAEDKVAFLKILETGLSPADEAFLEARLDDSRKEVRLQAADLLAGLPDSALSKRLFAALLPYLSWDRMDTLQIALPDELPEHTVRDGILPGKRGKLRAGMKADWLRQVVEKITPQQWNDHFKKESPEILRAMLRSNWATTLLPAVSVAVYRHCATDWIVALVNLWVSRNQDTDWNYPDGLRILELLPATDFNRIAYSHLQSHGPIIEENSLVSRMLCLPAHPWEDRLTLAVVKGFQAWMTGARTFFWDTLHYRRILEVAGYQCDPVLQEKLKSGWPYHSSIWPEWEQPVDRMLRIIAFRKEMRKEIERQKSKE